MTRRGTRRRTAHRIAAGLLVASLLGAGCSEGRKRIDPASVRPQPIGDLLAYLPEPSSHGDLVAVFVEENDPGAADPLKAETAERPWLLASQAWFVGPVPRERIMGTPYLVYRRREDAERIARRYEGARVFDWKALRARPLRGSNR